MLLPHFLLDGRGKLDTYFSRVYNPVWTNPDGFSWLEALKDETRVGCHVALTPTWSETAWFADYVLPMGVGAERHDIASFETHAGRWIGFRQPVLRRYAEINGDEIGPERRTHEFNPGEVWEENEFWIDLSWRIDPDGSLGIRQWFESDERPGTPVGVDEYYGRLFADGVPGLAEAAAAAGVTPARVHARPWCLRRTGRHVHAARAIVAGADRRRAANATRPVSIAVPGTAGTWDGSAAEHSPAPRSPASATARRRSRSTASRGTGFPTPSRKLELYSTTLRDWGWPEHATPGWIPSHVHWEDLDLAGDERILLPTFRIPTLIHTRSGNSKWLNEISHRHPLWIHPSDAEALGIEENGLVRITTRIGHFVIQAWRTEGIRPGVVAASHHMGRWRLDDDTARSWIAGRAQLTTDGTRWSLRRTHGDLAYGSDDADTARIWWHDTGVHQNLTFAVQPDPISGMHCWHQRVRVTPALADDEYGDVVVDTARARERVPGVARQDPAGARAGQPAPPAVVRRDR